MHQTAQPSFKTAIGTYLRRVSIHADEADKQKKIADMRTALIKNRDKRIARERKQGLTPNEAKLNANIEKTLADFESKQPKELETTLTRTYLSGAKYRFEQTELPNDVPFEELLASLRDGAMKAKPTFTRTWDGRQMCEIVNPKTSDSSDETTKGAFATLGYKNLGAMQTTFMDYGADDAKESDLLLKLASSKLPVVAIETTTDDGEPAIRLEIGTKQSLGLYSELVVLPGKNYVSYSSFGKLNGIVRTKSDFRDYAQTNVGQWTPRYGRKEVYDLDEQLVPRLKSKEEFAAVSLPEVDIAIDEALFDLSTSDEFTKLRLLTPTIEKQSDTEGPIVAPPTKAGNSRWYFLAANGILVCAVVAYFFRRSRTPR